MHALSLKVIRLGSYIMNTFGTKSYRPCEAAPVSEGQDIPIKTNSDCFMYWYSL